MTVGATIVARNYLPYARVLAGGWGRHHPGLPLRVLVIDGSPGQHDDGLDVVVPADLGIDAAELARMRGIYDAWELTTALKPRFLRHLLDVGAEAVVYLDSDVDVHADLSDLAALAVQHGTVLSPSFVDPLPDDGLSPSEVDMRLFGVFNSGVLAVGPAARTFLSWWAQRVSRDSLRAEWAGMHADQRWLDYVPSCFEHVVLRDAAVNVGRWNLHERRVGHDDVRFTVNGNPLKAFHFSGYDPRRPEALDATVWPRPLRYAVTPGSPVERLCVDYGGRLVDAGYWEAREAGYTFARSAAGTTLGTWERQAFRELLIACEAGGEEAPSPFDPEQRDDFERFIADPASNPVLSRQARARLGAQLVLAVRAAPRARPLGRLAQASRLMAGARPGLRRGGTAPRLWSPHPETADRTRLEYL